MEEEVKEVPAQSNEVKKEEKPKKVAPRKPLLNADLQPR